MNVHGFQLPGRKGVIFELDPKTALFVWFHLQGSMQTDVTTRASRIVVAGVLPQLRRAVLQTGIVGADELDAVTKQLLSQPSAPTLDDVVGSLRGGQ